MSLRITRKRKVLRRGPGECPYTEGECSVSVNLLGMSPPILLAIFRLKLREFFKGSFFT